MSQGGLQFYLSEIGRQLVEAPLRILKVRHYYVDVYTMISLMQYRASVGLHDNFVKAKELSRCVKGQFWSTLLFMFYSETSRRNVYLLKLGAKSFRDGSQDICKDTESNLGPFAGF